MIKSRHDFDTFIKTMSGQSDINCSYNDGKISFNIEGNARTSCLLVCYIIKTLAHEFIKDDLIMKYPSLTPKDFESENIESEIKIIHAVEKYFKDIYYEHLAFQQSVKMADGKSKEELDVLVAALCEELIPPGQLEDILKNFK